MLSLLNRLEMLLQKTLMAIAAFFLLAMVLMTCADILFRLPPLRYPLPGVNELMGYSGALVVACALGYTQRKKDHLAVDIVSNMFPKSLQKGLDVINRLACMIFSIIACWQVGKVAYTLWQTGEVSETLHLPFYPFTFGVAAGFALLAFVFFVELLKAAVGQE
ncbi:MAG: TRAP transporter small permease [Anaerohalosphaeraceae bacterium]